MTWLLHFHPELQNVGNLIFEVTRPIWEPLHEFFTRDKGMKGIVSALMILAFMFLKAGLIIMVFMHLAWERMAVKLLLFLPPIAILIFIVLMSSEAYYVFISRIASFFNP